MSGAGVAIPAAISCLPTSLATKCALYGVERLDCSLAPIVADAAASANAARVQQCYRAERRRKRCHALHHSVNSSLAARIGPTMTASAPEVFVWDDVVDRA